MNIYRDSEGNTCEAFQLEGPMILDTVNGEQCGSITDWVIYIPANNGRAIFLSDAVFSASFTLVG